MTKVAVSGAAGRMGATVVNAVESADDLTLSGKADPATGTPLAAVLEEADVVVDFSVPATALANVKECLAAGVHVVVGTTGFDLDAAKAAAEESTANCFVAPNFAIGAVLMMVVSPDDRQAHARRRDHRAAPRQEARRPLGDGGAHRRADQRGGGKVHEPIHSVRLPGLVAHQEVIFGGLGQTLSIRHDSIDRWSFMPGVLLAVRKVGDLPDSFTVGLEKLL